MTIREQENPRLQELGDFLRTRRARLAPEDVGLPRGGRRRAPGLRRVEVAQLAGVSVDWYTWLEQGRSITASTQVLESIVQALRLNVSEREHLFFLAHQQPPPERAWELEIVSPTLQNFLDHQGLSPAFVLGRHWDVVAWNAAASILFGDYNQLTSRERNSIWRMFTTPGHRHFLVDWEEHARRMVAQFRASCGRYPGDPRLTELIHDLMLCSPEFRAWWSDHEVLGPLEGHKTFNHPQAGYLHFEHLTFQVFDAPDLNVNVYTPVDEGDTPTKISQLLSEKSR
ncbi:transcriptional regulator [Dictyobacter alpinus]|uniref:Transcriptional regulator n=1 Tax=Dictyobacter alpinus TaxID=2014873 RepID=A0A402BBX8_9CHLR|nr:helix-turn-helix transcriptional regulator [Dictyobacter alpinus]GCE28855.1 transcriptional regulator [Dictyobacter alpinus]